MACGGFCTKSPLRHGRSSDSFSFAVQNVDRGNAADRHFQVIWENRHGVYQLLHWDSPLTLVRSLPDGIHAQASASKPPTNASVTTTPPSPPPNHCHDRQR
jgi:hypothetical protein